MSVTYSPNWEHSGPSSGPASSTQNRIVSAIPRSTSDFSIRHGNSAYSIQLKQFRNICMRWASAVLAFHNIAPARHENEDMLFNEMRFGMIPCQIMNIVNPGIIGRISEVQSTFSALENLAAFTAALVSYGFDRKSTVKPLDFINETPKGDEFMIKNIGQLAISSSDKGFTVPDFNLMEDLKNQFERLQTQQGAPNLNQIKDCASVSAVSLVNDDPSPLNKLILQRLEALDAETSRILRGMQDKIDNVNRLSESKLSTIDESLDGITVRLASIEITQSEILTKLNQLLSDKANNSSSVHQNSKRESEHSGISAVSSSGPQSRIASNSTGALNEMVSAFRDSGSSTGGRTKRRDHQSSSDSMSSSFSIEDNKITTSRKRFSNETHLSTGSSAGWGNTLLKGGLAAMTVYGSGVHSSSPNILSMPSSPSQQALSSVSASPTSPQTMFPRLPAELVNMGLPKSELLRQSVIYEIIDTENEYVKDLERMMNYHKKELSKKEIILTGILSESDIKTLFSNVNDLFEVNHKILLQLQAKREMNPVIDGIGHIFLSEATPENLDAYNEYCSNYPVSMKLLHSLLTRPEIKEMMQRLMNSSEGRGLSLESFLIKPVQRICKYPLLLRELLKNTEKSSAEYPVIQMAMNKMEKIVAMVNEATDAVGRKEKLLALQSKIESIVPLNLEDKKLIKEGTVTRITGGRTKERYMILFAEELMTCKTLMKGKYPLESILLISNMTFCPMNKADFSTRGLKHFFQLYTSTDRKEATTLAFQSEDEKIKWYDAFSTAFKMNGISTENSTESDDGRSQVRISRRGAFGKSGPSMPAPLPAKKSEFNQLNSLSSLSEQVESLRDIEMVESNGTIWKRAVSANGYFFYYNVKSKETSWKLPETYIILDPSTGKPYDSNEDAENVNSDDDEGVEPVAVEGYPDWNYVDRGDGKPYYFHSTSLQVSWYPPEKSLIPARDILFIYKRCWRRRRRCPRVLSHASFPTSPIEAVCCASIGPRHLSFIF